ncbi:hypothetical protein QLL95_gp0363 [Cotonvirus japonicus]|uniref:Uncharacterized protein n=1 Tax=Cotonvirus japonicus TaxID=2811091 RepID=A0ABM7NUA4_9VIRU|nr:hypothetical protein QLL95_gp0363 [Cotonvirus japonicus]BCS83760.1 hypothetical protein [Cotonvirus japonicus]
MNDYKQLDVNSFVNEYLDKHPDQAGRVIANIVGHSILALDKWDCSGSAKISNYVIVYNKNGMNDGFTKFGDDIITSDHILSAKNGDFVILLEGGPQSFKQSLNVLRNDIPIKALFNIRSRDRQDFFSATEFFYLVGQQLLINPELPPESVGVILDTYLKSHKAWDHNKHDADTKKKPFLFFCL